MNLTTIALFIKKYAGILIASITIPTLLVAIIFIYKNQKESQLPLLDQPSLVLFSTKIENLNTQNLKQPQNPPSRLPVYRVDQNMDYLKDSQSLASKLSINTPPIQANDINLVKGYIYANKNSVISIYKSSVSYQKLSLKPQKGNFDENKAADIAKKYLTSLGFSTDNLFVTGSSLKTIEGDNILETQDPQKADLITLDFGYTLSGIQTMSSQLAINASVDISGQVTSFNIRGLGDAQQLDAYPLINFNEATQLLTSGKGGLAVIEGFGGYASQLKNLPQIDLTGVSLAYYFPVNPQGPLQPIWVFDGQTIFKNSLIKVKVALPAIREKFFKKT